MKISAYIFLVCILLVLSNQQLISQGGPCNTVACSVCDVSATITSISGGVIDNNTSAIAGNTDPGETVTSTTPLVITATECGVITINVELDFNWNQGDQINWIHGISFENSDGWLAAEGVIIPDNPGWLFFNSMSGVCSDITYGAGYFWDPPGTDCGDSGNLSSYDGVDCNGGGCEADNPLLIDGDPADNWGIDCETDCPQFGFSLTYCPTESGTTEEVITFVLTEDGETGGWNLSDGCIFSLSFPIIINSAGIQLPDEDIGPICQDSCVVIDAGTGCDDYVWSTGETTSEITVCPSETTTYSVTVSSDEGCEIDGEITVIVEPCCEADAGILSADPMILCPGETSTITVADYQDGTDYIQVLIIVDENGIIEEIIDLDSYDLSSDICAVFTIYSYNYLTSGGATVPMVGQNINEINCDVECCDLVEIEVVFEDTEVPIFTNPPPNMTLDCIDDLPEMEDLYWTDNCIFSGSSSGVEEQSYTFCDGGEVTRTWTATDSCDNEVIHLQTYTISPVQALEFVNLPENNTIACNENIPDGDILNYTNNQLGSCLIEGEVSPTVEADTSLCGGTITYSWEHVDECEHIITHQQTLTLLPPPPPEFIDPPADLTIECGDELLDPIDLIVSNNINGRCKIEEIVSPTIIDETTNCGGEIFYTWEYADQCGNVLTHMQAITILPPLPPTFNNLPTDVTIDCGEDLPQSIDLIVSNNSLGNCLIEAHISPVVDNQSTTCGGFVSYQWDFSDECGNVVSHTQIITIKPAPEPVFIDPPQDVTVACDDMEALSEVLLTYSNNENGICLITGEVVQVQMGDVNICGATVQNRWSYVDDCGREILHIQNVTFDPAPEAVFIDVPADITVACVEFNDGVISLNYDNDAEGMCNISGSVESVLVGENNACGNDVQRIWTYIDECNRTIEYIQNIKITPASLPEFLDLPPATISISCGEIPAPSSINYTNGQEGNCEISGSVLGTISGNYDECGGTLLQIWAFLDECGNELYYEQDIEVLPAEDPVWVNPPMDITIDCDQEFPTPELLEYDNEADGNCVIQGYENAVVIEGENVYEYIWTYVNECSGNEIDHTQYITRPPTPILNLEPSSTTICEGEYFDLNTIIVSDQNGGNLDIQYFDESGQEIIDLNILAINSTTITILGTNEDGCADDIQFELNVDFPLVIGGGGSLDYCSGDGFVILYQYLTEPINYDGTWIDLDGSGANIDDPYAVNFDGVSAGIYNFEYTISSNNACQDVSAILTVKINAEPEIDVLTALCNESWTVYSVEISTNGNTIVPSEGNVDNIDPATVLIEDISIDNILVLTIIDPESNCTNEYYVNPPNCECPDVPAPISNGDQSICYGEDIPELIVTVEAGLTVNWYNSQSDGILLVANSLSYVSLDSEPGLYTYYAEAVNTEGCVSLTRTPVSLEIIALPIANDAVVSQCANEDGSATFDLTTIDVHVNENASFTFQYFSNLLDAEAGQYELENNYTTSLSESELIVKVTSTSGCINYGNVTFKIIELSDFEVTWECNDSGTSTDGNDDFYVITVIAQQNGSVNSTFDVLIDGEFEASLPYSTGGTFQLPAMGQPLEITLQDNSDLHCFATKTIGPLFSCSDACNIALEVTLVCDDGGTLGITDDDFYTLTFIATGINNSTSGYILTVNGVEGSTYEYDEEHIITFAANGDSHQLIFTDVDDSSCSFIYNTIELNPCSGSCSIEAEVIDVVCNNNDTNNDQLDDTFSAVIKADILEGTGTWIVEPGGYSALSGETIDIGPYNIIDGDVMLTISDSSIPSCSTTLTIQAPEPCSVCEESVDAGSNATLDCDITFIELLGSSSSEGEGIWTGPGGFTIEGYEATANFAGTYYFTVDFGQGCIVIDSLVIDVSNDIPIADAGPDGMLTCEIDTVLLVGTVIGGAGNIEYTWYGEDGTLLGNSLELEVIAAGNYFFEVKDLDTDCISPKDIVTVADETNGPIAVIYADPGDILDCVIELIYITNEIEQDVVYTWIVDNQPSTIPNITIDQPSDIELFALDTITGCKSNANLAITSLEEYPIVNVVSNGDLNCLNTEVTINGSSSQPGNNISYTWYDENNSIIATDVEEINVTEPGIYYLELMDEENGCTNIDTVEIEGLFTYPLITNAQNITMGCEQNELNINVSIDGGTDNIELLWSTENGNIIGSIIDSELTVTEAGEYMISVIDQESGCVSSETITVFPSEEIFGSEVEILDENCEENSDGVIILGEVEGGTSPYTFVFDDLVQSDNIVENLSAGSYPFSIFDANGCRFDTSVTVSVLPPFQVDLDANITIQSGQTTSLHVQVDILDNEIESIQWNPSIGLSCDTCLTTILDGTLAAEEYTVIVTDIFGCNNSATIRVTKEEITKVTFPNIISPNGDNINSLFTVYSDDENAKVLSMQIFDRWGEMIFSKNSFLPNLPEEGWDGTFRTKKAAQGVYVYMVEMELIEGKKMFSGDVTVVR